VPARHGALSDLGQVGLAATRQDEGVRTPLLLVLPLALLTACSSGGSSAKQSLDSSPTPTASTAPSSTAGTVTAAPRTSTAASGTAGSTTGGAATTTGAATTAPLSTQAPGKPAASKATAAGDYTYTSSGKVTAGTTPQDASGSQTLTISPLRGGIQHSRMHSDSTGDTEQDVVVRDTGSYLASLKLSSPAFSKEFRPAPAVLLMPDPATVGRSWSWSGTSTDGKTHVTTTNKLMRQEDVTIGGSKVATVVLQTHLVLSGDVNYDAQVTTWWAPAYRLPVKTHTVGKGSFGAIPFSTDVTAVLHSVKPS
jgi:hypothetical protein